jgi:hypothetical protein
MILMRRRQIQVFYSEETRHSKGLEGRSTYPVITASLAEEFSSTFCRKGSKGFQSPSINSCEGILEEG